MEGKRQGKIENRDISPLAAGGLCDWARGRNVALTYSTFSRQRVAFTGEYGGAVLKQPMDGLDRAPGQITQTN